MKRKSSAGGKILLALTFIFLYAPIIVLVAFSFNNGKSRSVWQGFTLDWYAKLFSDKAVLDSLYVTLTLAVLSAVIATIIGTLAAIGFFNMKRRWRAPLLTLNNIPMVNADIITGVSLCLLFVSAGSVLRFNLGFGTLLLAHIGFNIPYVILSVMPKLYQLDRHLMEAAQDLGCTWLGAMRRVLLPEIMPGVINGAIIAFTMSVDDFVISYFTAGGQVQTLPMTIYAMTRRRVSPEINAISTLLFVAVLALLGIITLRESRQARKNPGGRSVAALW